MSKPAGKQCDSCKRLGAKTKAIEGILVDICDECLTSDFRRERVLERARAGLESS